MRRSRWLVAFFAFTAFLYGFAAGSYRLPPFYQVAWLKNSFVERFFSRPAEYEPETATSVIVVETALQRLLVKRLQLPRAAEEFTGGGALATAGDLLYVVTSGGKVTVVDVNRIRRIESAIEPAPINRDDLMRSRARYVIALPWFRVSGAFAEIVNDSTQRLFVAHNRIDPNSECITFNISHVSLIRAGDRVRALGQWKTIYTTSPCMTLQGAEGHGRFPFSGHISGGKMISHDARRLLVTVGDFNFDGYLRESWPMDRSNPYGKFVLVDRETGASENYAIGARNDMGLFRDSTGTLWATESGPQGGDELNIVVRGANYGWPQTTYGINYGSTPWPLAKHQGRHEGFRLPVFAWVPSIVPTNLVRFEGHPGVFEAWRGDLLMGTLRDQSLHRIRLDSANRVVYDERIPVADRIRDLVRLADGKIALLTDATGFLVFIGDGGAEYTPFDDDIRTRITQLESYDALNDPSQPTEQPRTDGDGLFTQKCSSCHALNGTTIQGPPLNGVLTRKLGGVMGFNYSPVLLTDSRIWTPSLLRRYLLHPETDFVNTRMQKVSLTGAQADSIIAFLGSRPP